MDKKTDILFLFIVGCICICIGFFLGWYVWSKELMDLKEVIDICCNEITTKFTKDKIGIYANLANIICGIVAIFALYFSISSYRQTVNDERRIKTITAVNEIDNKFPMLDENNISQYLDDLEGLALGLKMRVYSLDVVYLLEVERIILDYNDWVKEYIIKIREAATDQIHLWSEYESMVHKLQAMWDKENNKKKKHEEAENNKNNEEKENNKNNEGKENNNIRL